MGVQQRVEIIKTALPRSRDVLILDEPTAVLTPQESRRAVRDHARRWSSEGTSIIFITHKLQEVLEVADRITVLRRGQVVGATTPAETQPGAAGRDDGRPRR